MEQYNEIVLENFHNPKNIGKILQPDGIGKAGNPCCGDVMEMYIRVEKNIIVDAKFQTFGCVAAIASSSITTQLAIGKTIDEAKKISKKDILSALGTLPLIKQHCSLLGAKALQKAIEDYQQKTLQKI